MDFLPRTGLVGLIAEIERTLISNRTSVVLVLFDGLGTQFLDERTPALVPHWASTLRAPFPSTTTVSLATVATGLAPAAHGIIGHLLWWPEVGRVVNMLKFVDLSGSAVLIDNESVLPSPNLWERLRAGGCQSVTVQPADFAGTPLTRTLYRGCRFVGAGTIDEFVEQTVTAAGVPGTFVFTYLPPVDYAAHVFGPGSAEVAGALTWVSSVWGAIVNRLPAEVVLMGTADHGVMPIPEEGKILIRDERYRPLEFWGDPRAVMVKGSARLTRELCDLTGARLVEPAEFVPWLGDGHAHHHLASRLPDAVLLAQPGQVILPWGFDKRLVGYHGGLEKIEVDIPLLVRG
ncbi:MAG: alkaline phosphatase family protein [Acidimicrobiia bacterium]